MAQRQLIDATVPEAFLARERAAVTKSEFVGGRIIARAGGSRRRSLVAGNSLVLPPRGARRASL